jgi:hypothetical protein
MFRSEVFTGFWLDAVTMIRGDSDGAEGTGGRAGKPRARSAREAAAANRVGCMVGNDVTPLVAHPVALVDLRAKSLAKPLRLSPGLVMRDDVPHTTALHF